MVVLSRQYAEKYMLFLQFSAGGLHDWGILLVIHLEFQEIKHQPFSMTQPFKKTSKGRMSPQGFHAAPTGIGTPSFFRFSLPLRRSKREAIAERRRISLSFRFSLPYSGGHV
ncbi:hypothetical protein [uncultured Bilophila sp.]|uniref:hypothetical protein n=1 Tax=uncultured Bilophila sp. TaxID=529385 RepID=UPI00266FF94D|nr:hypothetical protein [uncultured Bilophila sp.]